MSWSIGKRHHVFQQILGQSFHNLITTYPIDDIAHICRRCIGRTPLMRTIFQIMSVQENMSEFMSKGGPLQNSIYWGIRTLQHLIQHYYGITMFVEDFAPCLEPCYYACFVYNYAAVFFNNKLKEYLLANNIFSRRHCIYDFKLPQSIQTIRFLFPAVGDYSSIIQFCRGLFIWCYQHRGSPVSVQCRQGVHRRKCCFAESR